MSHMIRFSVVLECTFCKTAVICVASVYVEGWQCYGMSFTDPFQICVVCSLTILLSLMTFIVYAENAIWDVFMDIFVNVLVEHFFHNDLILVCSNTAPSEVSYE